MNSPQRGRTPRSLRWLSRDYAVLREQARSTVFDLLVIGSGYGGAMAAAELAGRRDAKGRPVRVCVLERGREYAPGMFASSLQDLPPHVRVNRKGHWKTVGPLDALLDVRVGPDVCALVGNGLGGTSLINAGVMEEPDLPATGLPPEVQADLTPDCFNEVKAALAATPNLQADHPALGDKHPLAKTQALRAVAERSGHTYHDAWITVQTRDGDPNLPRCTLCGDCMTGCNIGAKRSLDTTLLAQASARGAEIYTGGSVLSVRRDPATGDWLVESIFTNESLRERHEPVELRARKVILAAGALGSTEILLRSRRDGKDKDKDEGERKGKGLAVSTRLGERFSCNGDNLLAVYDGPQPVHASANEWEPLDSKETRRVGPTITGVVKLPGLLLEEFAIPAALKRLFEESVTTSSLFQGLTRKPRRTASQDQNKLDSMAVDAHAMEHTLVVGVIGHDESAGRVVVDDSQRTREREGCAHIEWPQLRESPRMEAAYKAAREALGALKGAEVLPNPLWRLLPPETETLVRGKRGSALTVHPLGGCAMGRNVREGVVDHLGRVFNPDAAPGQPPVHDGLVVLDGSIIPGSLGANPALTIAAVARRAARGLATCWQWDGAGGTPVRPLATRERYREPAECTPTEPVPTQVQIVERLAGKAGGHWVEWTLTYESMTVAELTRAASKELKLVPDRSFLRVYEDPPPPDPPPPEPREFVDDARTRLLTLREHERAGRALYEAHVSGTLTVCEPPSTGQPWPRALRALWHWFVNRGVRELWDVARGVTKVKSFSAGSLWGSAHRAAELRCLDYKIQIVKLTELPDTQEDTRAARDKLRVHLPVDTTLTGSKRLTYGFRSNPWLQLTRMKMRGFPGVPEAELRLDTRFLVRQGFPLLHITRQQNQVVALAELASLGLAWFRTLVSIHLWSFRAPDMPRPRELHLLPGPIAGLPTPTVHHIDLEPGQWKDPVRLRLTRYPHASDKPPVMLIHGYSSGGNTYTHPAVPHPLARHLWQDRRDVWVLDMRTSLGMPTSRHPWRLEDAALADVPMAVAHIRRETGRQVDVFAHCIGAVMLSMSLLASRNLKRYDSPVDIPRGSRTPTRYRDALKALRCSIRRIVLSQKGPVLVYCDDNILRAYFMRVLRRAVLPDNYEFQVPQNPGIADQLLDRILATLPYPPEEFARENPFLPPWKRAPWAGFRHRMDALYARDFTLANMADATLNAIEDLFAPLNLETVAQAIHFARQNTVTDGSGRPFDTSIPALQRRWPKGGTLSIHGADNGLVDVKTLELMRSHMRMAGIPFDGVVIEGHGHQDCLIGIHAKTQVFPHVTGFLNRP